MVENSRNSSDLDPKKDASGNLKGPKKSVFTWTVHDVQRWLQKYHTYHTLYGKSFRENHILGKVLVQLTSQQLQQMGVDNEKHRADLLEKIIKLRLKSELAELKVMRKTPQTPK